MKELVSSESIGIVHSGAKIVNFESDLRETAGYVQQLPANFSVLMESVDTCFGSPSDGYAYVVIRDDIHISTTFELEYVYSK
jgi:hypothetical protein